MAEADVKHSSPKILNGLPDIIEGVDNIFCNFADKDDGTKTIVTPEQDSTQRKKRKIKDDSEAEIKRIKDEEYERQLHEQRYKRLMHLLDRSQFYTNYLFNKIEETTEKEKSEKKRKHKNVVDENVPPHKNNGKKEKVQAMQEYDIRKYISEDVKSKYKNKRRNNKLNLSQEEIEEELNKGSDKEMTASISASDITPKYFNGTLYPYQVDGLQWLKVLYENGINGILGDEMGLGKTIQVIALLCHLIEKQQSGPYLIVAPLSTIPNWLIEFERFAPLLPIVKLYGPKNVKQAIYTKIKQKMSVTSSYKTQPIVLTTYETVLFDVNFLRTQHWRYIVIDEGQRIKNPNCMLIKALKSLKSMNRLLLTGTPLQNNLAELWSLLNFLLPEIFNDLAVFESWFDAKNFNDVEGRKKFFKQEEEKKVLTTLREILKPFMLRREKAELSLSIPPKKELVVYTPLTQYQHDLYKAVLHRDIERLTKIEEDPIIKTADGTRPKRKCVLRKQNNELTASTESLNDNSFDSYGSHASFKSTSTDQIEELDFNTSRRYANSYERNCDFIMHLPFQSRLAMYIEIVNHPYLIECPLGPDGLPKIDENIVKVSGKLLVLDAMLKKLKEQNHKVLLFSTMTMLLDVIESYLSLRDFAYVRLDGTIKDEERKDNINEFNNNPDVFLFLLTSRAGGVGLNLMAADTVIMYDSDWNPQVDIQAMARCHRIGQTRPVIIYRFCTKGTIDEEIIKRAQAKRILEKMVISKEVKRLNVNTKEGLLELRRILNASEDQVVSAEKEEAELNKLLDRSDLYEQMNKSN